MDQVGRFSEGETGLAKGSHVIYGEENTGNTARKRRKTEKPVYDRYGCFL